MATIWFCLVAVMVAGYVVLDGFDLGAGMVQLFVARSERETTQVLSAIGPVWDGNEVWLVAAGGVLFFAFPALYASAFSGFYLLLMIALWLLILRGVSIEFRSHIDSPLWKSLWGATFGLASSALALGLGVALGNVVRGVPLDESGYFFLPLWISLSHKDPAGLIDWYTLAAGATALAVLAVHGCLWVVFKTSGDLQERTRSFGAKCWVVSIALTLLLTVASFRIQPNLMDRYRCQPWGIVFPVLALAGMIGSRVLSSRRKDTEAFLAWSLYLAAMLASVAFGLFPNVLSSISEPRLSLTIHNAAAAEHGLIVGLWWFLPGMALAIWYAIFVYRHSAGKVH